MSEAIPINSDDEDGDTNPNVGKRQPKQKKFGNIDLQSKFIHLLRSI